MDKSVCIDPTLAINVSTLITVSTRPGIARL